MTPNFLRRRWVRKKFTLPGFKSGVLESNIQTSSFQYCRENEENQIFKYFKF